MKTRLFKRRQRMLRLLAMENSLHTIVSLLASEFSCTERAIYADYENMNTWAHALEQDKQLTTILRARLDLLNREALNLLADATEEGGTGKKATTVRDKFVKIGALNTALKITVEQKRLGQELGLIERKPEVVQSAVSLNMPFEVLPEIKKTYAEFTATQKAEKDAAAKQTETDAGH